MHRERLLGAGTVVQERTPTQTRLEDDVVVGYLAEQWPHYGYIMFWKVSTVWHAHE